MKLFRIGILLCLFCVALANAQSPQLSPEDTLYLGRIPEGKMAVRKFQIYNLDSNTLNVSNFSITGTDAAHFSISDHQSTFTVGAYQKTFFDIQFQPATEGYFSAHLVVESNAPSSPDHVVLEGYGTKLGGGFIAFERIFGDTKSDGASSVHVTPDGGYILCGSTRNPDREYNDAALIKTDMYGQVEWRQVYGIEEWSEGFSEAIPTDDGGYLAVGNKAWSDKNYYPDVWVVKTDAMGNVVEWEDTFGDSETDGASYVIQTEDGGYMVTGSYSHATAERQDSDAYLIKLASDGTPEWEKTYGSTSGESAGKVIQMDDGGYLFAGSTSSYGAGEWDLYLVKVDASGNEEWYKTYGSTDWENGGNIIETSDSGYLLTGWTASFGAQARDAYIVKLNSQFNEEWYKIYGDIHKDSVGETVETEDGYIMVGSTENTFFSQYWRSDGYILKIDKLGNFLWSKTYGGIDDEGFGGLKDAGDGGFVISGNTGSFGNSSEIYFLKINGEGMVTSIYNDHSELPTTCSLKQNYPNPFNNQTLIKYQIAKSEHVKLEIFNLRGQCVNVLVDGHQNTGYHTVTWTANGLASGLYLYRLRIGSFEEIKRMLLLK